MVTRPVDLPDYVGQKDVKNALSVYLASTRKTGKQFVHTLLYGHAGLGKTSLATIIAKELGYDFVSLNGSSISIKGDILSVLMSCASSRTIVFIDEIHAIRTSLLECLYTIMEDGFIDLTAPGESIRFEFSPITIIGATTEVGSLPKPLIDRFGYKFELTPLSNAEKSQLLYVLARKSSVSIDEEAINAAVPRLSGIPREIVSFFDRCIDHLVYLDKGNIDSAVVAATFNTLGVDEYGLDKLSRNYLSILASSNRMGVKSLSNILGESIDTIESIIEPRCFAMGLLARTTNGRSVTDKAKAYLAARV